MFFPVLVVSPDGDGRCQGDRGGLLLQESDGDLSVVQRRHPQAVTGEEESVPPLVATQLQHGLHLLTPE